MSIYRATFLLETTRLFRHKGYEFSSMKEKDLNYYEITKIILTMAALIVEVIKLLK
jgi:F0F1-type ATP synthase assembly protein I